MAFIKKIWKDRISQFPNRRTINDGYVTKQVTVGRDEGTITEQGDAFDASNMNDLEQRIEDCYGDVQALVGSEVAAQYNQDNVIFDPVATPGHGVGYAVTSEGVAAAVQDAKDYTDTAIGGLNIPENISDLDDVTITTPTDGEILVYNNGVWENQANPASTANFAPDYDDTATYNTNDKVIYQGLLYVCLEDSVTGAWDSTKWQNISVADYNAELLPIQSGSATNTKDYIDSGLSGKADTFRYIEESGVLGALTSGASGYVQIDTSVPTGYKTTGIWSISKPHPGTSASLVFGMYCPRGLSGNISLYLTYYTASSVSATNSDYQLTVMCEKA